MCIRRWRRWPSTDGRCGEWRSRAPRRRRQEKPAPGPLPLVAGEEVAAGGVDRGKHLSGEEECGRKRLLDYMMTCEARGI
jgi:hypothetical protein